MKKIGFIGMGHMACDMAKGFVVSNVVSRENLFAYARNQEKLKANAQKIGFTACRSMESLVSTCDVIIIAVNPDEVKNVTGVIKENMKDTAIVLSVASSVKLFAYEAQIGDDKRIARVMPNTLIAPKKGYSAICYNEKMDAKGKEFCVNLLSALGQAVEIEEELFDAFTAFSCTGPLWIYKFIEAMTDAGVYVGFARDKARNMVLQNLIGTAQLLSDSNASPAEMVDKMTSPGGNTIEGVKALYENGMANPIMESMSAVLARCRARG